ncbi:putative inactive beta-glucosidase 14 [Glycine max]|nr:putative inactive beta-glucosidase 14 [Glycine max]
MGAITSHTNKMKMLQRQLSVVMTLLCCVHFHVQCCDEVEDAISRSDFPEGFLFGTSTSSYQIEGAPFEDGRGLSNWDVFSHTPGKIKNDENGDIADDHYHRYLEDIELMSSLGVNVYRFSISWTRILPRGIYGDINPNGIMFYNKIIDNLLLRGIEPFVTIHHHDLPQELEERYGGWISLLMQRDFVHFAEICFKSFGDRVKYWTTINEPALVANYAYMKGIYAPGHCSPPFGNCNTGNSDVEPLIVVHNMLLAHAKAVELYRKHFQAKQGGTIGIVAHSVMYEPLRDEECDRQAVNRALAFLIPWVLDPLYPAEMHSILGSQLPVFSLKEKSLLKGSIDFIGINHYGSLYVKDCSLSACSLEADHPITGFVEVTGIRDGVPIGDQTGFSWFYVVPRGMQKLVDYVKIRYHNIPMYITENGYCSPLKPDETMHDLLQDVKRIDYHKAYLAALLRAIRKGADVRGYMIWSLLDNFEWANGYEIRYGLYHVNRDTHERIPKLSVQWFSSFLNNTIRTNITEHLNGISRSQFPEGFLFGTCTSSYQIEGAPLEDGKGLSNWDVFSHIPGNINNDENGDIADDHYHRYLEDIELMSSLGINVYRFSISWARILHRGIYGDINPSGVMFYNKIIDNLLLRGIEPFVTIHHHDYPGELEERYGAWLSPLIQRDFVHFAEVCFKSFGDRVKYWATINEPNLFADMGFIRGTYPPGHCSPPFGNCNTGNSDVEPLIAVHNMILSHAKAVELYRKHFQAKQGGIIGIVTHTFMYEPLRDEECDRQAYPPEMHSILGSQLPRFSPEEKSLIKGSIDFIGINNYGTLYAKDCSLTACPLGTDRPIRGFVEATGTRDGIPIGDLTGNPRFFVVPRGLEKIVDYIKIRYHNMPMYITENGYSSPHKPNVTMDDLLQDFKRIDYHKAYLAALLRAIRKGADVRGYMIWSLMDNFEWTSGYGVRYGLYYVDRHTLERIPKRSVQWFSSFLNDTSHSNKQDLSEQYVRSKDVTTAGFKVV